MREIFNFFIDNWNLIVSALVLIASVIISIIRKRPISSIYVDLYDVSIDACKEAENTAYKGSEKMSWAITYACSKLKAIYPEIRAEKYIVLIGALIERILSTPQKKEVK